MEINESKQAGKRIIAMTGRLDVASDPEFEEAGLAALAEGDYHIVVDLSKLVYISSAGLRSILVVGKKAKANGGNLSLCGLTGIVKEVFEMSGFDSFFGIYDDVDQAVEA